MAMFIHFFCLCPLGLTIKLNFNTGIESGLFMFPEGAKFVGISYTEKKSNKIKNSKRMII